MLNFGSIPEPTRFRLGTLFEDNYFIVPPYQRNFAWQRPEVDDFLRDVEQIVVGAQDGHFFGQIVTYCNQDGVQELIDGQQRLTTGILFISAIGSFAAKLLTKHRADISPESRDILGTLQVTVREYIRGEDEQVTLAVQRGKADRNGVNTDEFFQALLHMRYLEATTDPTKNMANAYKVFHQYFEQQIQKYDSWTARVNWLIVTMKAFTKSFYVVMIAAPSQRDAFIIFESLNSRGKNLNSADIIKNHVLYIAGGAIDRVHDQWEEMSARLNADGEQVSRFLRSFWAARQRITTEGELYRHMSRAITTGPQSVELLDQLNRLVPIYVAISASMSQIEAKSKQVFTNAQLRMMINILTRINSRQHYPIIFSMVMRGFSEEDMIIVLQKVLAIVVRHRILLNAAVGSLESSFSSVAQKIWQGQLNDVESIRRLCDQQLLKPDVQVIGAVENYAKEAGIKGTKKWIMVYLLSELFESDLYYSALQQDAYQAVRIEEDGLENSFHNYLGNWTLLEKSLVSDYDAAQTAVERATVLKRSDIQENRVIAKQIVQGWRVNNVISRQKRFAKRAIIIW